MPLQGDRFANIITQGVALGWELLPFTFPLRAGDRWFRACCVIPTVQVEIFLLLMLLKLLIRKYFYFLCFWSCCRLARVTFCTFGAVAGLQGSLFVLLGLLQACKGHF